ncbi:MAG: acylase [Acidobacteria bacterium]|nr:acylase [Acidobacteriota bacterium]
MQRTRAIFLLLLIVCACSSAPAHKKKIEKPNAEILWDSWGVPHVFAQDEAGAFRGFGWAQMHSHGNLLPRLLAQGRGRAAEVYGQQYLTSDRAVRTMGIYERARRWHTEQSPQFRENLNAFAGGINEYAKEHPEKLDSAAKAVLPVDGIDILAHTTRVLYEFISVVSGCSSALPEGSMFGSNAWAIGPSHSASGHAMLLANPHLPWGGEMTWIEAQISAPGYEAYGAALVGFPVLAIAFNETHGWSHTVNTIDACDVYELTRENAGYKFEGGSRPLDRETQTIRVKQDDGSLKDEKLEVRHAVQGPVVEKDGKLLALRIAGLQAGSYAGALEEWWEMGRASNFAQFQAALQRMQLPMFNVIYADRRGHIELLFNGLVPVRSTGDTRFWHGVVPGDTSALVWNRFHSYADLPKAIDPPAGWVQNSNSAPWYMTEPFLDPARYPAYLSARWNEPFGAASFREQRGLRMLKQDAKLSFEQLLVDKYSTRSELADRIGKDLIGAATQSADPLAKQAAAALEKWDHETNADSRGALLFLLWLKNTYEQSHGDFLAEPFDPKRPLETPRGLKDPRAAVAALIAAANQMKDRGVPLDAQWGQVNHLRRGKYDFPGNGAPDGLGIFRVIAYAPAEDGRFDSVGGDSFVAAVEFSSPLKARVLMTYGNASDPGSPHFGDQLALTARKEWREPWRTRAEIEQHLEAHTIFHSGGAATSTVPKQH